LVACTHQLKERFVWRHKKDFFEFEKRKKNSDDDTPVEEQEEEEEEVVSVVAETVGCRKSVDSVVLR
jgi:hypothetical protein